MNICDKTIVILGGTSGIGLATAKLAVERGAKVVVTGRDAIKAQQAKAELGPNATAVSFDANDLEAVDNLFTQIGPVDHLILSLSGGRGGGPFASVNEEDLRAGFEQKFFLHWNLAQASLKHLAKDGSITFVTSASSRSSMPGTVGLAAINGAIEAMVAPMAAELKPLRVNAVSPGVVETPWWDAKALEAMKPTLEATAVGRAGHPEEVAEAILLVASNGFITGAILDCDGGIRLK